MKRNTRPEGPVFTKSVQHFKVAPAMYEDVLNYQKLHGLKSVAATFRELIQRGLNCPANQPDINEV